MNNKFNSISPFLLTPLLPNNVIIYKAPNKLPHVTSDYSSGIRINRFGKAKLLKHIFKNGVGTLKFDRDVTEIGERAFSSSNITGIDLPNSIIKLNDYCFNSCLSLTSIELKDNLEYIGNYVFHNTRLQSLIIPDSVITLGSRNFSTYSSGDLKYIKLGKGLKNFNNYSLSLYNYDLNNPTVIEVNYETLGKEWNYASGGCKKIIMGPNVKYISDETFYSDNYLLSVSIGNHVKSIGNRAFQGCYRIPEIIIPNSVTSLGINAFLGCNNVKKLTIGTGIKVIPGYCFLNCGTSNGGVKLDLIIPNNIIEIQQHAFDYTRFIKKLTLPKNLTKIGEYAFYDSEIEGDLIIPKTVTNIDSSAFGRNNISNLIILSNNLKVIPIWCFLNNLITELNIPEGVEVLESNSFYSCLNLTTVRFPSTIKTISDSAFVDCTNIQYITENGLSYLDLDHRCLASVDETVTTLNIGAETLSISANKNNFISTISNIEYINVDSNNPKYDSRNNCNAIIETASNRLILGCGNTNIPNGITLLEWGSFRQCKTLETLEIPSTVTGISSAFEGSTIQSINIPNSVTYISSNCFYNCTLLTTVVLSNSMTSISSNTFTGCTNLSSITIPNSITDIDSTALTDTAWLNNLPDGFVIINGILYCYKGTMPADTSLTIPSNITKINRLAVLNQSNLISVTVPSSVSTIDTLAFYNCSNLTTVTINSNSYISLNFNSYSKSLKTTFGNQVTKYIIGDGATKIGDYAFYLSTNLTTVELPEGITTLGNNTFKGCPSLVDITIPSSVTTGDISEMFDGSTVLNLTINCNKMSLNLSSYSKFKGTIANSLIIGEGVTSIGKNWFYDKSFKTLELPSTLTSLDYCTFYSCDNLTSITIKATTPPTINYYTFNDDSSWKNAVTIYVPAGSVSAYKAASIWESYKNKIQAIPNN